jgi:iron complex transport system permease protein
MAAVRPADVRARHGSADAPIDARQGGRALLPLGTSGTRVLLGCLVAGLVVSLTIAVQTGPVSLPASAVWAIIGHHALGLPVEPFWDAAADNIVWLVRLPRVLMAVVVGGGLAVVGVAFQALVRNALADPYLLGASSGASVGATAVIVLGILPGLGIYALSISAFVGALSAVIIVFVIARSAGGVTPLRLILSGTAMAGVFASVSSFLILAVNREAARAVMFWLLGSLAPARWAFLGLPTAVVLFGTCWLVMQARLLNALVVGDDTAMTLGVDVHHLRRSLITVASLVTGVLVAVSGTIGFVGLMIPHLARFAVGSDHRRVLPVAALLGAVFLVWADVGARVLIAPAELPIGVITSLVGAPFFVLLMRRSGYGQGRSP